MKKVAVIIFILQLTLSVVSQPRAYHNLYFDSLATRWDEGIPLGNGWLGALIWKKGNNLRLTTERTILGQKIRRRKDLGIIMVGRAIAAEPTTTVQNSGVREQNRQGMVNPNNVVLL